MLHCCILLRHAGQTETCTFLADDSYAIAVAMERTTRKFPDLVWTRHFTHELSRERCESGRCFTEELEVALRGWD